MDNASGLLGVLTQYWQADGRTGGPQRVSSRRGRKPPRPNAARSQADRRTTGGMPLLSISIPVTFAM